MNIPIERILPNPEQPRVDFDAAELESLAESIRENGVIQPVVVEEAGENYILHDGERRTRAAKLAGLTEIPAYVTPALNGSGQRERLVRAMVANLQRSDLSPIEEAQGYQRLADQGLTVRNISKQTGIYEARVHNRMVLLRYDAEIQDLVRAGKFHADPNVCRAIMEIPEQAARIGLARKLAENRSTIKASIAAAGLLLKRLSQEAEGSDPDGRMLEIARRRRPYLKKSNWNMLAQVGRVPAWRMVEESARAVCSNCIMADIASEKVCGECPGVFLLERLMTMAQAAK